MAPDGRQVLSGLPLANYPKFDSQTWVLLPLTSTLQHCRMAKTVPFRSQWCSEVKSYTVIHWLVCVLRENGHITREVFGSVVSFVWGEWVSGRRKGKVWFGSKLYSHRQMLGKMEVGDEQASFACFISKCVFFCNIVILFSIITNIPSPFTSFCFSSGLEGNIAALQSRWSIKIKCWNISAKLPAQS